VRGSEHKHFYSDLAARELLKGLIDQVFFSKHFLAITRTFHKIKAKFLTVTEYFERVKVKNYQYFS